MPKDTVAVEVNGRVLTFLVPAAFVYNGKTYLLRATKRRGGLVLTLPSQKDLISQQ